MTETDDDERKYTRKTAEMGVADLAAEVLSWLPQMSDEEWKLREAQLANARAAEEAERLTIETRRRVELCIRPLGLGGMGWPELAIEWAQKAEMTPYMRELLATQRTAGFSGRPPYYWEPQRGILVLSGPPGCGKTVAAALWALGMKVPPMFVRSSTFATSSRYGEEHRRFVDAPDLVLDDLGSEYVDAKGSFLADLDELVDTFYGAKRRRLVITTNLHAKDFEARYGGRAADRLRERGTWFEDDGGGRSLRQHITGDT